MAVCIQPSSKANLKWDLGAVVVFSDFIVLSFILLCSFARNFCSRALGFALVNLVVLSLLTHAVRVVKLFQLYKVENSDQCPYFHKRLTALYQLQCSTAPHILSCSCGLHQCFHTHGCSLWCHHVTRPIESMQSQWKSALEFQKEVSHLESGCALQWHGKNMQKDATRKSARFSCVFYLNTFKLAFQEHHSTNPVTSNFYNLAFQAGAQLVKGRGYRYRVARGYYTVQTC